VFRRQDARGRQLVGGCVRTQEVLGRTARASRCVQPRSTSSTSAKIQDSAVFSCTTRPVRRRNGAMSLAARAVRSRRSAKPYTSDG
jgi:hypothetical protein